MRFKIKYVKLEIRTDYIFNFPFLLLLIQNVVIPKKTTKKVRLGKAGLAESLFLKDFNPSKCFLK